MVLKPGLQVGDVVELKESLAFGDVVRRRFIDIDTVRAHSGMRIVFRAEDGTSVARSTPTIWSAPGSSNRRLKCENPNKESESEKVTYRPRRVRRAGPGDDRCRRGR